MALLGMPSSAGSGEGQEVTRLGADIVDGRAEANLGANIVDGRDGAPHYATVYPFNNTNKISKNNYYPSIEVMEKM